MSYCSGLFVIDGLNGPYEGFSAGDDWNGWACPVFERSVAEQIADDFRTQGERHHFGGSFHAKYDPDTDSFAFRDPSDDPDEEPLRFESGTIDVDGRSITVYYVGTRYWTWEAA